MRHYVLTRSVYGPEWTLEENARRLAITRAVTARLMAAQTSRTWTWVVALHPDDPLIDERREVCRSAAPAYRELIWAPPARSTPQAVAASAYRSVPWSEAIGPRDTTILQTRLDDDDGLAVDAIRRAQASVVRPRLMILMFPIGVRVWAGRYSVVRHNCNAMHTLVTPPGNRLGVYDYGHTACRKLPGVGVKKVSNSLGWLWVRHRDTISGWKMADRRIDDCIRATFPIDWGALEEAWR